MKKYLTYLLCAVTTIVYADNNFDAFCSKFPLMELPIVSDSRIYGDNLYYFQLDKESSITEEEFERFVKTSRWGQYQQPVIRCCIFIIIYRLEEPILTPSSFSLSTADICRFLKRIGIAISGRTRIYFWSIQQTGNG